MNLLNPNELNAPLSDDELEFLDQFLLNRLDEDLDTEGKDEGIFDIATLDGFFTALVSGPITVSISHWLPAMWGDFPYTWASEKEFEKIFGLFVRHMNSIVGMLMYQPEDFEPLFYTREVEGKTYDIVDEWCEGYRRGLTLAEADWFAGGDEVISLLTPILAFTESTGWTGHEFTDDEVELLQNDIAPSARKLHAFWLAWRGQGGIAPARPQRSEPKIGRNAPCPCGSGKKFKHCCLH